MKFLILASAQATTKVTKENVALDKDFDPKSFNPADYGLTVPDDLPELPAVPTHLLQDNDAAGLKQYVGAQQQYQPQGGAYGGAQQCVDKVELPRCHFWAHDCHLCQFDPKKESHQYSDQAVNLVRDVCCKSCQKVDQVGPGYHCDYWMEMGFCDDASYPQIKNICARSCTCEDDDANCPMWAQQKGCTGANYTLEGWEIHCRKSCNVGKYCKEPPIDDGICKKTCAGDEILIKKECVCAKAVCKDAHKCDKCDEAQCQDPDFADECPQKCGRCRCDPDAVQATNSSNGYGYNGYMLMQYQNNNNNKGACEKGYKCSDEQYCIPATCKKYDCPLPFIKKSNKDCKDGCTLKDCCEERDTCAGYKCDSHDGYGYESSSSSKSSDGSKKSYSSPSYGRATLTDEEKALRICGKHGCDKDFCCSIEIAGKGGETTTTTTTSGTCPDEVPPLWQTALEMSLQDFFGHIDQVLVTGENYNQWINGNDDIAEFVNKALKAYDKVNLDTNANLLISGTVTTNLATLITANAVPENEVLYNAFRDEIGNVFMIENKKDLKEFLKVVKDEDDLWDEFKKETGEKEYSKACEMIEDYCGGEQFNCEAEDEDDWDSDHQEWCCLYKDVGSTKTCEKFTTTTTTTTKKSKPHPDHTSSTETTTCDSSETETTTCDSSESKSSKSDSYSGSRL